MERRLILSTVVAILLTALLFSGCSNELDYLTLIQGETKSTSDKTVTLSFPISNITVLDVNHYFSVEIIKGKNYALEIEIDKSQVENLVVGISKEKTNQLVVTRKPGGSLASYVEKLRLTVPFLASMDLSGNTSWKGTLKQSEPFFLEMSNASKVEATLDLTKFTLHSTSSSTNPPKLSGKGGETKLELGGDQDHDFMNLSIEKLDLDVSGGTKAKVKVKKYSKIKASRDSYVYIEQNEGEIYADLSSTAKIEKVGKAKLIKVDD